MTEEQNLTVTGELPVKDKPGSAGTPQIRFLSRLIEVRPDAPVNYLLRGEEWLVCGRPEQARADFEEARARSEHLLRESAWGYILQSYIDRAEAGLRQCSPGADDQSGEEF
jgi:hypothetical protein